MKSTVWLSAVCIAVSAVSVRAANHYSLQLIPSPADRPEVQLPDYINNSGTIAAVWWANDTKFLQTAEIIQGASVQTISIPSSTLTVLGGLNNSGAVAGSYNAPNDIGYAFKFDTTGLQILKGRNGTNSGGYGINDAGTVVGGDKFDSAGTQFRAVQWINNQPISLGVNEGVGSSATAINNLGEISGHYYTEAGGSVPFQWKAGQAQFLPITSANGAYPIDINSSGEIAGWAYDSSNTAHSVAWVDGKLLQIGELAGGTMSYAFAVNDSGTVVGNSIAKTSSTGVKYENGKLVDLNSLITPQKGLHITDAVDVNNQGQILVAATKNNKTSVYLMTPQASPPAVPLPPAVWASVFLLPVLLVAMRRMRKAAHRPLR